MTPNAPEEPIFPRIFTVRETPVMLDSDLAQLYGVTTASFNQAVVRNAGRFPSQFSFVLTRKEFIDLISQIVISKGRGGRRKLPRVFTEHGAIMAAMILNSERAVAMSVYVVQAFVKMRQEFLANATLEARLQNIEKTLLSHDTALRDIIQKLRPLLLPPPDPAKPRIGFHAASPSLSSSIPEDLKEHAVKLKPASSFFIRAESPTAQSTGFQPCGR